MHILVCLPFSLPRQDQCVKIVHADAVRLHNLDGGGVVTRWIVRTAKRAFATRRHRRGGGENQPCFASRTSHPTNICGAFGLLGFNKANRFRLEADDIMLKQWEITNRRMAYFPTPVFQYSSP